MTGCLGDGQVRESLQTGEWELSTQPGLRPTPAPPPPTQGALLSDCLEKERREVTEPEREGRDGQSRETEMQERDIWSTFLRLALGSSRAKTKWEKGEKQDFVRSFVLCLWHPSIS